MKKSIRTLVGATVAATLGVILLLGGTGTFARWSDTSSSSAQRIQSGTLDLGTVGLSNFSAATITQCTPTCSTTSSNYTGDAIVPGDVISVTINVPVTLVGKNLKAQFSMAPSKAVPAGSTLAADAALRDAVSITVKSVKGVPQTTASAPVTLTPTMMGTDKTVPVVVEVKFPWGQPGDYNGAMGGKVALAASYTLTQIAS